MSLLHHTINFFTHIFINHTTSIATNKKQTSQLCLNLSYLHFIHSSFLIISAAFQFIQLQSSLCNIQFLMFLSFYLFTHLFTHQNNSKTSTMQYLHIKTDTSTSLLHVQQQSAKISKNSKQQVFQITLFCISYIKTVFISQFIRKL